MDHAIGIGIFFLHALHTDLIAALEVLGPVPADKVVAAAAGLILR